MLVASLDVSTSPVHRYRCILWQGTLEHHHYNADSLHRQWAYLVDHLGGPNPVIDGNSIALHHHYVVNNPSGYPLGMLVGVRWCSGPRIDAFVEGDPELRGRVVYYREVTPGYLNWIAEAPTLLGISRHQRLMPVEDWGLYE